MIIDTMKAIYGTNAFNEPYHNRQTLALRLASDIQVFQEAKDMKAVNGALVNMMGRIVRAAMDMDQTKCVTKDCHNHRHEGAFEGELCGPCAAFVKRGEPQGQAWKNAINMVTERIKGA